MILYLRNPPKHSCSPVYGHYVRAVVNLIGTEDVPNNYLITDPVVFGDFVRPDLMAVILFYCEEIPFPIREENRVGGYGGSSRNITAGCEYPLRG